MTEWRVRPLDEVATVVDPNPTHRNPEYITVGGYPFITTAEFIDPDGIALETRRRVALATVEEQERRCSFAAHSIAFSRKGTIGKTRFLPVGARFALLDSLCVITAGAELFPAFLRYALDSPELQVQIGSLTKGVALQQVSVGAVRSLRVPVPPLEVQRQIAKKLAALLAQTRAAREQLEAVPALVQKYRQSVLAAAFRGDLTAEWRKKNPNTEPASKLLERIRAERRKKWEEAELAKMKAKGKVPKDDQWKAKYVEPEPVDASGLPELPPTWCWESVDALSEAIDYGTSTKTHDTGEVAVLRMGSIFAGELTYGDLKYLPARHAEFPELLLRPGDVLFNRTNSPELVGKTAVFRGRDEPTSFASYLLRVRLALHDPDVLTYYINSPAGRDWVRGQVSQQVGQANVNGSKLRALAVPVPPLAEQCALVDSVGCGLRLVASLLASNDQMID